MAAKRRTGRTGQNADGGFAVHVDKDEMEKLELSRPDGLPPVGHGPDAADPRATSEKAMPTWRDADRGRGLDREQAARQARRYAFRRS